MSQDRPELRKYIIATVEVGRQFSNDSPIIQEVHREYDAGTIDLAQWREGRLIHLLRYPRRVRDVKRRRYFS